VLARRHFLLGLAAAPAVIRTPGLLMRVKPLPPLAVDAFFPGDFRVLPLFYVEVMQPEFFMLARPWDDRGDLTALERDCAKAVGVAFDEHDGLNQMGICFDRREDAEATALEMTARDPLLSLRAIYSRDVGSC
jgi:hypothetical protein